MKQGVLLPLLASFLLLLLHARAYAAETSGNPRLRSPGYDELYNDAQNAYVDENWSDAAKYFEQAISDYRHERTVRVKCRLQCREKFRKGTSKSVILDLELDYFRYTIYSHKCTQKCLDTFLGKRLPISKEIQKKFEERDPYVYLQFAYYKSGRIPEAARATFTALEMKPEYKMLLDNLRYMREKDMVDEAEIYTLEPVTHQKQYFAAARLFEERRWDEAIDGLENALVEYYKAYDECKLLCEERREENRLLGRTGLYGVYVDVLECRSRCPEKLSTISTNKVNLYLERHYNYLQMAYFRVGKMLKAAECATSFLLLSPNNDVMIDNLRYYYATEQLDGVDVKARKEAIAYNSELNVVSKLLHLAKGYLDDLSDTSDGIPDGGTETPQPNDLDGLVEDLVEDSDEKLQASVLMGLGPMRDTSHLKDPMDLIYDERFKGITNIKTAMELNGTSERVAVDNLATQGECDKLIHLAGKTASLGDGYSGRGDEKKPFSFTEKETFEGVTLMDAAKASLENRATVEEVELYANLSERVRAFTEDYFALTTPLYFSYSHLVCRTSLLDPNDPDPDFHISHPVHSDNCLLNRDGPGTCPKRSPAYTWRDYSAILYLNGNFSGGEFIFANSDETIQAVLKPECGRAVAFSAGAENLHGVIGITAGRRCALALWFTLRMRHQEFQRNKALDLLEKARQIQKLQSMPSFQPNVANHVEL